MNINWDIYLTYLPPVLTLLATKILAHFTGKIMKIKLKNIKERRKTSLWYGIWSCRVYI